LHSIAFQSENKSRTCPYVTPQTPPHAFILSHLLPIHVYVEGLLRVACWQPVLWVLVVERPRRDDDEEGEGGAGKPNVQRQADVLCEVADEEGDNLQS
jgi:hypothetical protein